MLARQQLQDDYEKLKRDEADKSAKLKELMLVSCSPRRCLDKADKEIANLQTALKNDPYIIPPEDYCLEKSVTEEKSISPFKTSPLYRTTCNIHPLHLHLLISVTMIFLTHRYPQLIVLM